MNLRREAKGRDCTVQLPCCNHDPETTVLAHVRSIGLSGMGMKSPDEFGAWACFNCHDAVDRRRFTDYDPDFVRLAHLEGMLRTQATLKAEGKL